MKIKLYLTKIYLYFRTLLLAGTGKKLSKWKDRFINESVRFNFPIHKPYNQLSNEEKNILWDGKENVKE